MTAVQKIFRHGRRFGNAASIAALSAVAWWAAPASAMAQDLSDSAADRPLVDVAVDEARVVRLNQSPSSVIIGNPMIADAVIEENGLMILIGRQYGTTNLIALDDRGEELANYDLVVRTSGSNAVALFRGTGRVSLNCTPRCEYELDVGDTVEHFEAMRTEIQAKNELSRNQGGGGAR